MKWPVLTSRRKIEAVSNGVFLISLGILFYTNAWWPGILLAIWAALAVRQYLTNRKWDLIISSIILLGLFIVSFFNIDWHIVLPFLFILGGAYIIFREYLVASRSDDRDSTDGSP